MILVLKAKVKEIKAITTLVQVLMHYYLLLLLTRIRVPTIVVDVVVVMAMVTMIYRCFHRFNTHFTGFIYSCGTSITSASPSVNMCSTQWEQFSEPAIHIPQLTPSLLAPTLNPYYKYTSSTSSAIPLMYNQFVPPTSVIPTYSTYSNRRTQPFTIPLMHP